MKKTILALAIVSTVVSCKKVSEGGNHDVIKIEEGAPRYSDDKQSTVFKSETAAQSSHTSAAKDSAIIKTEVPAAQAHESTVNSLSAPVNHGATETK